MPDQLATANQALAEIGSRSQLLAIDNTTPEGRYIGLLYGPIRDFLLREGDYDFALKSATLASLGTASAPWIYAYTLPTDCIRIRQLIASVYDPLSPLPLEWNLDNAVIVTRTAASVILYTYPATETAWDAMFHESFVKMLGSALSFALQNRMELSKEMLNEALQFAGAANMRDQP